MAILEESIDGPGLYVDSRPGISCPRWFPPKVLANLLALAAVCPFVGSLSDLLGRRYVALTGAFFLVLGSVVASTADTMNTFIGTRPSRLISILADQSRQEGWPYRALVRGSMNSPPWPSHRSSLPPGNEERTWRSWSLPFFHLFLRFCGVSSLRLMRDGDTLGPSAALGRRRDSSWRQFSTSPHHG